MAGDFTLRAISGSDWALEVELSRDPAVVRWTFYPEDMDEAAARSRLRDIARRNAAGFSQRFVILDNAGSSLGTCGIGRLKEEVPEVFYALAACARGRGAATAATKALVGWARESGRSSVALVTVDGNERSEAVAHRLSFVQVEHFEDDHRRRPAWLTRWVFPPPEPFQGALRRSTSGCPTAKPRQYAPDMGSTEEVAHFGTVLDAAEDASPVEAVEAVTRRLGVELGAISVSFLIADLSGRALVRLAHVPTQTHGPASDGFPRPAGRGERREAEESAKVLPFDGGPAEQALRTQSVRVVADDTAGEWKVLAPVTERGESIGLLEVDLPEEPSRSTVAEIARFAHLLAFVVIANRRHTDLFEWGQRTRPFSLSAEIQQRLLPGARTCEAGAFTLSAWLEPAASIGGDTFDYSLERDLLHLSVSDAMGHGVAGALTATLCVGSLRGARRQGASLLQQAAQANAAVAEQAARNGSDDFVTGLLGRLDLREGSLELVNAGHTMPYLAREGSVSLRELPVDLPLGMFTNTVYRSTTLHLEPGDRFVIVTDGMLERDAANLNLGAAIAETRVLHPREAVRFLADRVLDITGHALSDDATVLCLDWHGAHDEERTTVAGADPDRASSSESVAQ